MSDERKEELLIQHLSYVFNECRICAEHHNYNCSDCPREKLCKQAYQEIKLLIQQQPKIDGLYVRKKIQEILENTSDKNFSYKVREYYAGEIVTQIISDVRGKQVEVDEAFIEKWTRGFRSRDTAEVIQMLTEAGVTIKK